MDWGNLIQGIAGLASGVIGAKQAGSLKRAARRADAMAPYRAGYAKQLADLASNPNSIINNPGYQFALKQGEQTLERTAGKQGQLGGGTEKQELQQFSEMFAGDYLAKEEDRLAGLAGVGYAPTALQGQQAYTNTLSQSLASLGYGIRSATKAWS